MAIRIQINQRIPCPVEEYFLTAFFFVIYFIREEIHHKAETVTGKRILCHAVQLGICFETCSSVFMVFSAMTPFSESFSLLSGLKSRVNASR